MYAHIRSVAGVSFLNHDEIGVRLWGRFGVSGVSL
jgi:hypothetical protein